MAASVKLQNVGELSKSVMRSVNLFPVQRNQHELDHKLRKHLSIPTFVAVNHPIGFRAMAVVVSLLATVTKIMDANEDALSCSRRQRQNQRQGEQRARN
jgi:hypothetical protein